METANVFLGLSSLPRWVPYKLIYNPKRDKFDKIPHNGRHGISTADATQWTPLIPAVEMSNEHMLSGVGFVMTGGVDCGDWKLIGMDFDGVNFEEFKLPFNTYAETSPSGTGIRALAWVPSVWADKYKDITSAHPADCDHAEFYLGTAPRFLTITFKPLNSYPIAPLEGKDLVFFEKWMTIYNDIVPPLELPEETEGKLIDLTTVKLTDNEKTLISGRGNVDRSEVLHGLNIKLIDANFSQGDILATIVRTPALWQYCMDHRHNAPPRALKFAQQEIAKAYNKSNRAKRDKLIGFNKAWKADTPPASKLLPTPVPQMNFPMDVFSEAPGLIKEIAAWILAASYAPREEFAYASALSMVSCLIGPYCTQGPRHGKLNLYLTLVGDTGTGKNEAIDMMAELLAQTEAKDCVLDFPASEAALRRQLNLTPNVLLRVDELAHKLDSMKNNSNGSSLGRAILEGYNGARMPPKVYADEKKTLPAVENPYIQILGGTTDKVWDVVKASHMEDGTLNRFMFVCLPDDLQYRRNHSPNPTITNDFKLRLNKFWRNGKRYDLLGYKPSDGETPVMGRQVLTDDDVDVAIVELDLQIWEKQRTEFGGLYSRFVQNTLKIASILAVSDDRLRITMHDFEQARKFVDWCITNVHHKLVQRMADTHFERLIKRLINRLIYCNGQTSMRDAYKFMHIGRREMEELTTTLVLSGEIEITTETGTDREWLILVNKESPQ